MVNRTPNKPVKAATKATKVTAPKSAPPKKAERVSHLRWVPIKDMKICPRAQREFRPAHAERMARDFDLEAMGFPVVNWRDGHWYVVDGQHRVAALRLIGYGDQQIQCEAYEGLTEAEEAELFLRRDDRKAIPAFDKFQIAKTAGRPDETDVDRIVRAADLVISRDDLPGAIQCPSTLLKVYRRDGVAVFSRAIRIIRDAYGDAGFSSEVIDGLGLFCQRYNGAVPDGELIEKLSSAHGGVSGLVNKAQNMRLQTGNQKAQCIAAAATDIINRGRGKKLPSWWKS